VVSHGGGVVPGAGGLAGAQVRISNARTPAELGGPFMDVGGSAADGFALGGDLSFDPKPSDPAHRAIAVTSTAGIGLGGKGGAFVFTVTNIISVCR